MDSLIDAAFVRVLGNIPENIEDDLLAPHIEASCLKVAAQIGTLPTAGPDLARAKDAAGCFAIAYALPVINTFYLSEAAKLPRRIQEAGDYRFHESDELVRLIKHWEERGYSSLRAISRTTGSVGVIVI